MMGELAPRGAGETQWEAQREASQLRASHEDRDAVIETLRVAAGDGRLTAEELDERLEIAFNAKTYGELAVLTSDLPAGQGTSAVAPAAQAAQAVTPKEVVRIDCRSGHVARDGQWVIPRRIEVKVTSGHVKLDLTSAIASHRVLDIEVDVRSGHLNIVTKPGIAIDTDEVQIRSGHVGVKTPWGHDVPVSLQVNLSGRVGSGHISARPRRRTFWQWLTRQPMPWAAAAR